MSLCLILSQLRSKNNCTLIIIIIIGIDIAPFPFIKCSKALHIGIVLVIVHNASMGEPEKVCFETLLCDFSVCIKINR